LRVCRPVTPMGQINDEMLWDMLMLIRNQGIRHSEALISRTEYSASKLSLFLIICFASRN
jgi:hypothetical protein